MKALKIIVIWSILAAVSYYAHQAVLSYCFSDALPVVSHLTLATDSHSHAASRYTFVQELRLSRSDDLIILPLAALILMAVHLGIRLRPARLDEDPEYRLNRLIEFNLSAVFWTVVAIAIDKILLPRMPAWPLDGIFGALCLFILIMTAIITYAACNDERHAFAAAPATNLSLIMSVFVIAGMEYGLIVGCFAATYVLVAICFGKAFGGVFIEMLRPNNQPKIPFTPSAQA